MGIFWNDHTDTAITRPVVPLITVPAIPVKVEMGIFWNDHMGTAITRPVVPFITVPAIPVKVEMGIFWNDHTDTAITRSVVPFITVPAITTHVLVGIFGDIFGIGRGNNKTVTINMSIFMSILSVNRRYDHLSVLYHDVLEVLAVFVLL
jgi:hypothetical protein